MKEIYDSEQMRARLLESLKSAGISKRKAGINAKRSASYVHSIKDEGNEPSIQNLAELCRTNGISLAYVLLGIKMSPETEVLLQLMESDPKKRDALIALIQKDHQD